MEIAPYCRTESTSPMLPTCTVQRQYEWASERDQSGHIWEHYQARACSAPSDRILQAIASCLTRENAGIDTLLTIAPRRLAGQDATLKANT